MPRYLPVQLDSANQEIQSVYQEMSDVFGYVPNFISTLAHSQNFLRPVADLYKALSGETGLSEKIRQLVILKTCKLEQCKYTLHIYEDKAKQVGWSEEQIAAMDSYQDSDLFNNYEKELLQLVELVSREPDEIPEDYWMTLDNHFTSDQIVEILTLITFCNMLNRFALALGIDPDAEVGHNELQAAEAQAG